MPPKNIKKVEITIYPGKVFEGEPEKPKKVALPQKPLNVEELNDLPEWKLKKDDEGEE